MASKTLFDGAFTSIPASVRFPWEAAAERVEVGRGSEAVHAEGLTVLGGDEVVEKSVAGSGLGEHEEPVDFTGAFGGTERGAVNMMEVEQAAADERAEQEFIKRQLAVKAAQAARALASATPISSRVSGRKTGRTRGMKTVSSDPDSGVLEEAVDASGLLVSLWESRRNDVSAKEQMEVLIRERAEAEDGATCVHSGSVCLYDPTKGYGFIAPDAGGPDIYFGRDSIEGWEPEAAGELAFPPYLIPGERIKFEIVSPEEQQGGRGNKKIRAITVRGDEGVLLLARAVKEGKRLRGVVRQMNVDNCKGHIQFGGNAEGTSRTEPTPAELGSMTLVERVHAKGFVDASFTHPCAFMGGGGAGHVAESLQRGTLVEYTVLRDIDVKSGKPVAVCVVPIGGSAATGNLNAHSSSSGGGAMGGGGARGGRRTEQGGANNQPQQHVLLFDDGDTTTW